MRPSGSKFVHLKVLLYILQDRKKKKRRTNNGLNPWNDFLTFNEKDKFVLQRENYHLNDPLPLLMCSPQVMSKDHSTETKCTADSCIILRVNGFEVWSVPQLLSYYLFDNLWKHFVQESHLTMSYPRLALFSQISCRPPSQVSIKRTWVNLNLNCFLRNFSFWQRIAFQHLNLLLFQEYTRGSDTSAIS